MAQTTLGGYGITLYFMYFNKREKLHLILGFLLCFSRSVIIQVGTIGWEWPSGDLENFVGVQIFNSYFLYAGVKQEV